MTKENYPFTLGVVTHTAREEMAVYLRSRVAPDVMSVDDGTMGCGKNHLHALQQCYGYAVEHYKNWVVILEDDAYPVQCFRHHINECIKYAPSPIVSLYSGTGYPGHYQSKFADAAREDVRWILHRNLRHAVGYCIEASLVPAVMQHIAPLCRESWAPDDAISSFCRINGVMVSYTNPSLVDHRDTETVIKNRTHMGIATFSRKKPRKAHRFGSPVKWDSSFTTVGK